MYGNTIPLCSRKPLKDLSKSVARTTKMSIIAVKGNALDKKVFDAAEKANRSADIRLEKVLTTYTVWRDRTSAKYVFNTLAPKPGSQSRALSLWYCVCIINSYILC